MKLSGKISLRSILLSSAGCTISAFSHATNSVRARHVVDAARLVSKFQAKPGTTWYVQYGRWTMDGNVDVKEYNTAGGPMVFRLGDKLIPFSGDASEFQNLTQQLVPVLNQNLGWVAGIDYGSIDMSDPFNPRFEDPILVVAYVAGTPQDGLTIAYPQAADASPHPAVELFFNGNWRGGQPTDGECKALTPGDYLPTAITIPGSAAFDETGGRGSNGDEAGDTTRGAIPETAKTIPALVSTVTMTPSTTLADLGWNSEIFMSFNVWADYMNGYQQISLQSFSPSTDTVADLIEQINGYDTSTINASLTADGKLVVMSLALNPDNSPPFEFTGARDLDLLFGAPYPATQPVYFWDFLTSFTTFSPSTLLAQFAPKGKMEIALAVNHMLYDGNYDPVVIGTIGTGGSLSTMGDLIAAVNATGKAHAYLEGGHLVIGARALSGDPVAMLSARYMATETVLREAGELLFGASDYRYGWPFRYDDTVVTAASTHAIKTVAFVGALPEFTTFATIPTAETQTGEREFTSGTLTKTLYPEGYLLMTRNSYGMVNKLGVYAVSATSTLAGCFNYFNDQAATMRFVDGSGDHASSGFIRVTAGTEAGTSVIWVNPATGDYGPATRLFIDNGDDGTAPTNVEGKLF